MTIVGEGPEESAIRGAVRDLPRTIWVELVPALATASELYARMKSATMLVLPSEREGYGLVVAEAQACGTVPIVIRAPDSAAAELVEDGRTGLVVNPTSFELATAISSLLHDAPRRQRIGTAAMAISADRDWCRTAEATAVLFERLRSTNTRRSVVRAA